MLTYMPEKGSNIVGPIHFYFKIKIDAGNAPTLLEGPGATVSRTGAGAYSIILKDPPQGEFKYMMTSLILDSTATVNLDAFPGGYKASTQTATATTRLSSTGALNDPPAFAAHGGGASDDGDPILVVHLVFGSPVGQ